MTRAHLPIHSPAQDDALIAQLLGRLSAAGLRRTLATRAVLGVFLARPTLALTHSQVAALLKARGCHVDRVTVYRLLDRFVSADVLARHTDDERQWRFTLVAEGVRGLPDAPRSASPQLHCRVCRRDLPVSTDEAAVHAAFNGLLLALAREGHAVEQVQLHLHGRCADCARRDESGSTTIERTSR
ncbi:MAG: Fur family transcriptional regulator [Hydrogenophaga sp.]|uniref:Fur family transcriptional regulator n=1 Tax=Hydrogenophaga sp. TaxID=1904254 RepID=UPI001D254B40|nr:Fur family transcriptional regulator [Hydrogenophaga sp.]MBX3610038.1 Fur family transcriptional regulator [Hydrogenophaga sp.]